VWLDRGEIFHFTRHPRTIAKKLKKAQECLKEGNIKSPVSKRMMDTIIYDLEIKFYQCPESKGLWFSSGQLKALLAREKQLQLDFEKEPPVESSKGPVVPANDRQPLAKTTRRAAPLTPLSNLFAGSFLTLAGLYAVMTLVLISAVEFAGLGPKIALGAAVVIVLLQFIFSPWIMDFTLRWLYKMEFIEFDELPESSQELSLSSAVKENSPGHGSSSGRSHRLVSTGTHALC